MNRSFKAFGFVVLSAFFLLLATGARAEEQYQAEVSALYSRMDTDDDLKITSYGLMGEVFFAPVNTAKHAHAEAAFLERAGSVFAAIEQTDYEGGLLDADGPLYLVGVNYAKPGFPLAIAAYYAHAEVDYQGALTGDITSNTYAASVGNYFMDNLLAGIQYSYSKYDENIAAFGPSTSKLTAYGIFAKYVHDLGDEQGLSIEAALAREKDKGDETLTNTVVDLQADYYITRSLSAGFGVGNNSGDDEDLEGNTYSANARYFITPRFSVQAVYSRFDGSSVTSSDDDTITAIAAARF